MMNSNKASHSKRSLRGKFTWPPVVVILVVHALAIWALFHFSTVNLVGLLISHFVVGCIGGVIGLHRYFSHKSFQCPKWFEAVLGFLATLNFQNGPITWAMYHRAHHRFSDERGDPHSASEGFFWSHIQWMFYIAPNGFRKNSVSTIDLQQSDWLVFFDKYHLLINVFAPLLFFLVTRDLYLTLWVFPLRTVIMWHSTWLINSYIHSAKFKPTFCHPDDVKNSFLVSALLYGEGWHLNHHRYPGLPRAGLRKYEFDPAYRVLQLFRNLRIIKFRNKKYESIFKGVNYDQTKTR